MANVVIDIATEFTGKKAFKQAETANDKLIKSTKKLAGALGLTFGTAQVIAFSKAAVRAFAEDDKAATTLSKTLSNLGLAFADPRVKTFIADLEKQYGVLDDFLRPAYQKLITTTGNWQKSQDLLKIALDLSAQSGEDLVSVAGDLGKAYVGNTKGLQKYSLGLTKAELASLSFEDILKRIIKISGGQAAEAADTYAGKLDKLTVASANLSEKIGGALLDAFIKFNGGDVDKATGKIETFGTAVENLIRLATGTGDKSLSEILNGVDYKYGIIPTDRKPNTNRSASPAGTAKRIAAEKKAQADALKAERERVRLAKEKAAAEAKILKDKRLGLAIDKANLVLNKGTDVFDMDKIQNAAALTNQAQLLAKATNGAELLQIANDTARLNVKKSILALEDAIAAKDEAAIIAATGKLNEDLKILGALTGQKTQMAAIESILKGLTPKDLIDQKNLDEALRKIREMLDLLSKIKAPTLIPDGTPKGGTPDGGTPKDGTPKGGTPDEIIKKLIPDEIIKKLIPDEIIPKLLTPKEINKILEDGGFVPIVPSSGGTTKGGSASAGAYAASGFPGAAAAIAADAKAAADAAAKAAAAAAAEEINRLLESGSFVAITAGRGGSMGGSSSAGAYAASGFPGANNFNITVNTGVGDPNAIAEAISNVLREAQDRGTLTAV